MADSVFFLRKTDFIKMCNVFFDKCGPYFLFKFCCTGNASGKRWIFSGRTGNAFVSGKRGAAAVFTASQKWEVAGKAFFGRPPKMAVPIRTIVAPSAMATRKS